MIWGQPQFKNPPYTHDCYLPTGNCSFLGQTGRQRWYKESRPMVVDGGWEAGWWLNSSSMEITDVSHYGASNQQTATSVAAVPRNSGVLPVEFPTGFPLALSQEVRLVQDSHVFPMDSHVATGSMLSQLCKTSCAISTVVSILCGKYVHRRLVLWIGWRWLMMVLMIDN